MIPYHAGCATISTHGGALSLPKFAAMSSFVRSLGLIVVVAVLGCGPTAPTTTPVQNATSDGPPSQDEIKRQVDDALDFTYTRRLDTKVNAAWQIIHGCIPYKQEFLIRHNGEDVKA